MDRNNFMKTPILSVILIFFITQIYAQDVLYLKNGETKEVSIIEKNKTNIIYKSDSVLNEDTTYKIKLSKLEKIHFSNGNIDFLSSQNPRSIFPLGVSIGFKIHGILFPTGSFDYFITPKLSSELYAGCISTKTNEFNKFLYFYLFGFKYWFASKYNKNGFSPNIGFMLGKIDKSSYLEVPLGFSYISKSGFQSSVQFGFYNYLDNSFSNFNMAINLGWRFKSK